MPELKQLKSRTRQLVKCLLSLEKLVRGQLKKPYASSPFPNRQGPWKPHTFRAGKVGKSCTGNSLEPPARNSSGCALVFASVPRELD